VIMAKWDIDKELAVLERLSGRVPGTLLNRVIIPPDLLQKEGLKLTKEEAGKDSLNVWALALGGHLDPKTIVHGRTLREGYLRARKVLKPHGKPKKAIRR
jgi:hypothetical protein